ncbi:MAG TPA: hypothetical protein VGI48_03180 [Caldimonas sp.]|jgi:hypothetical protein
MRFVSILLLVACLATGPAGQAGAGRVVITGPSDRPASMAFRQREPRVLLQGTLLFLAWSLERDEDDGPVWLTLRDYDRAHVLFEWSVPE